MKRALTILCLVAAVGCKSPAEKASDERAEGAREVGAAATKVADTEKDAAKKIADAKSPQDVHDAKVEATKDLADANKKLGDEKAEATREIAAAEATAGNGGTLTNR
jgi:hypothetical protein